MEALVISLLEAVAQAAPGVIATWTGHADDGAAIKHLRDLLAASKSERDADAADLAARKHKP